MDKIIKISEPIFSSEEIKNVKNVLKSGWLTQGKYVEAFENHFSKLHNVKYSLATTSCTTALHLILSALEIKKGDEVIVPSFTWVSTINSILYCAAKPVLVDICLETLNASQEEILKKINKKTKAILVVNLFGYPFNVKKLKKKISNKIKIIEDSACATGAQISGKFTGHYSDASAFSFHPRKIITTGEGGMVTTNSKYLFKKMSVLRNHGATPLKVNKPYLMARFKTLGYNYRMSDLQGAVGFAQLKKLNDFLKFRRKFSSYYQKKLGKLSWLKTPKVDKSINHSWQAYVCLVNKKKSKYSRNKIIEKLSQKGIFCRPGTHAVHNLDYFSKRYSFKPSSFPNSDYADKNSIALPLHNKMKIKDFEKVIKEIKKLS